MWCRLILVIAVVSTLANVCQAQFTTVINVPPDPAPTFIGSDTRLNVRDGGMLPNGFNAGLTDDAVGNVEVNISGGTVGAFFNANSGSRVTISGGDVGSGFDALTDSQVRISGGTIGTGFNAHLGSDVTITGGSIGGFDAFLLSQVFIAGGSFEGRFNAFGDSRIDLFGTEFFLDGIDISAAIAGKPMTLGNRGVELEGTFVDGSSVRFDLSDNDRIGDDFFATGAALTLAVVSLLPGDYNSNGTVEQADLDLVLLNWGEELFNPYGKGWINDIPSGAVDQEELDRVLLGWGNSLDGLGAVGVPEPRAAELMMMALVMLVLLAWRRAVAPRRGGS